MSTRIVVPVHKHDGEGSTAFNVAEDFETCLTRVCPLTPPSSALEHRAACTFTDAESGDRIYVNWQHVAYMEENPA